MKTQYKTIIAGVVTVFMVLALLFVLASHTPAVSAQATATNTPTATNTLTPTPTLVNTPFPLISTNGLSPYLLCRIDTHTAQAADCIQIHNGSHIHAYSSTGARTLGFNGETGNMLVTGVISATGGFANNGVRCWDGEQTVTGSATVIPATLTAAGIATPSSVTVSRGASVTANSLYVDSTHASGGVVLQVWSAASTPATTPIAVDYHVCGYGF